MRSSGGIADGAEIPWVQEQGAVTTRPSKVDTQLGPAAVQIFAANDRMNQVIIEHLDPAAWRAKPPGKVRTHCGDFHAHAQCALQMG